MYQSLKVENRVDKSEVRPSQLRREGFVPGVVFGGGIDSIPLKVQKKQLVKFLQASGSVFELELGGTTHLCNLDNIQKNALGTEYLHVSFHKLKAGQKTTVNIPVNFNGEPLGLKEGGITTILINNLEVEGLPKNIPESIEVDISSLEINANIPLSDLKLPEGCTFTADDESILVSCTPPKAEKVEEPEVGETEGEAAAEGEAEAPKEES